MKQMNISPNVKEANKQLFELCASAIEDGTNVQTTFVFVVTDAEDGKPKVLVHVLDEHEEFAHKDEVAKIFALRLAKAKQEGSITAVNHVSMLSEAFVSRIDHKDVHEHSGDAKKALRKIQKQVDEGTLLAPSQDPNSLDALVVATMGPDETGIITAKEISQSLNTTGDIERKLTGDLTEMAENLQAKALNDFWYTYKRMTA